MARLNHRALWQLAAEKAKEDAACMWPPHQKEQRRQTERRLRTRYYKDYVNPPNFYGGP